MRFECILNPGATAGGDLGRPSILRPFCFLFPFRSKSDVPTHDFQSTFKGEFVRKVVLFRFSIFYLIVETQKAHSDSGIEFCDGCKLANIRGAYVDQLINHGGAEALYEADTAVRRNLCATVVRVHWPS